MVTQEVTGEKDRSGFVLFAVFVLMFGSMSVPELYSRWVQRQENMAYIADNLQSVVKEIRSARPEAIVTLKDFSLVRVKRVTGDYAVFSTNCGKYDMSVDLTSDAVFLKRILHVDDVNNGDSYFRLRDEYIKSCLLLTH